MTAVALILLTASLSACASEFDSAACPPSTEDPFAVFNGSIADYEPASSPIDLATRSELVLIGRLERVRNGRLRHVSDPVPGRELVVSLTVERVLQGILPSGARGRVYVEFAAPVNLPAGCFDPHLPRDSDVLIYLTSVEIDRTADDAHVDAGRPFDQPLWQLTTPQGLLIATGEGVVQLAESGLYEGAELTDFLPDRNGFPPSIPLSGDG